MLNSNDNSAEQTPSKREQNAHSDASFELRLQRLEQLARRQAEALARRIDFLASEPRAEKLLEQTLKAITEQLGGDAGTLCMYEGAAGSARCVEYRTDTAPPGATGGAVHPAITSERVFREANGRHASVLNDISGDPRLMFARDYLRERQTQSLLAVPLWLDSQKLGYLFVSSNQTAA